MTVTDKSMTETNVGLKRRGSRIVEPQDAERGYHEAWYPICWSHEIDDSKMVGVSFLNGRVVAFRGKDGTAAVLSAYCRHVGADLSAGEVKDGCVVCPFHHWAYDETGACVDIPQLQPDERIPEGARQWKFPTADSIGIIWAWSGDGEPTNPVPHFPGYDNDELLVRHWPIINELPIEPWIALENSADIQHLRELHRLEMEVEIDEIVDAEGNISYEGFITDPMLGRQHQRVRVFGTNAICLQFTAEDGSMTMMGSAMRIQADGSSAIYQYAGALKGDLDEAGLADLAAGLDVGLAFGDQLSQEDNPIMEGIHFREDSLLKQDRALAKYVRYVKQFPRGKAACDFLD